MSELLDLAGNGWQIVIIIIAVISYVVSAANKTKDKKPAVHQQAKKNNTARSKANQAAARKQATKRPTIQTMTRKQEKLLKDIRQESDVMTRPGRTAASKSKNVLRQEFGSSKKLKRAMILKEVLDKPVSLRK